MVADTSQGQALRFHYDGAQVEVPIEYTNPAEYAVTTDGNLREMEGGCVSLTVTRNGKPYANRQMVSVTPPTNAVVDTDMVTDTDGVFKSNSVIDILPRLKSGDSQRRQSCDCIPERVPASTRLPRGTRTWISSANIPTWGILRVRTNHLFPQISLSLHRLTRHALPPCHLLANKGRKVKNSS